MRRGRGADCIGNKNTISLEEVVDNLRFVRQTFHSYHGAKNGHIDMDTSGSWPPRPIRVPIEVYTAATDNGRIEYVSGAVLRRAYEASKSQQ